MTEKEFKYFQEHHCEPKHWMLKMLLEKAKAACSSHIEWNTYEVFHLDTYLKEGMWRVQLCIKFNLDLSINAKTIPAQIIRDLLVFITLPNHFPATINVVGNGYKEVSITVNIECNYK